MPKINKPQPVPPTSVGEYLSDVDTPSTREGPVWRGPLEDGITFSLLGRFLVCRERFRLLTFEGLAPADRFNKALGYGNMWHLCEEWWAKHQDDSWINPLRQYSLQLCEQYRLDQEEIELWYNVCKIQFPEYIKYWQKYRERTKRTRICEENEFRVLHTTQTGNRVLLRGKIDAIDYVEDPINKHLSGVWMQENKSKGTINEKQITQQLRFDAQTMIYSLVVSRYLLKQKPSLLPSGLKNKRFTGVRYNCVRRPLSGGKGTIQRHKARGGRAEESWQHFFGRLEEYIINEPHEYFFRWNVEVSEADIERFVREFLDPILDQLCTWYGWMYSSYSDPFDYRGAAPECRGIHYRSPFGVYNVLQEGGSTSLDDYLDRGSEVGLTRIENLFPELKEGV